MKIKISVLFVAYWLCCSSVYADDFEFNWLGSTTGDKSALSGRCKGLANGDLNCNLRQISFSHKLSSADAKNEIAAVKDDLDT